MAVRAPIRTILGPEGPKGDPGTPGQSAVQRTSEAYTEAGQVVRTAGITQTMAPATASLRNLPFDGLALATVNGSEEASYHVSGPVPTTVLQLGAGVACAVGVNSSGVPVRATDPTCVSSPNWLGTCDAAGNVTVAPRRDTVFNVLDFGAVGDGVADDTPAFLAALSAIDDAEGGTVYVPRSSAYYKITSDLGEWPSNTKMIGDVVGGNGLPGSQLRFTATSGSGVYPVRQVDVNNQWPTVIENLWIANNNASNTTGAGVEFMGGGGYAIRNCRFTGWKYQLVLDGTNTVAVSDCVFTEDGTGYLGNDVVGIWTTSGDARGHGWTITFATNVVHVTNCFFNGPDTAIWATGGYSQHYRGCLINGADLTAVIMDGLQACSFTDLYFEGNKSLSAYPEVMSMKGCIGVTIENHLVSSGGATGVPWIRLVDSCRAVTVKGCVVACGHVTDGSIKNAGECYEWSFGPNYIINNHGTPFSAADTGGGTVREAGLITNDPTYGYRHGINTVRPLAFLDVHATGTTDNPLLRLTNPWSTASFKADTGGSFCNHTRVSHLARETGGSAEGVAGKYDDVGHLILAAAAGSTPFDAYFAIPNASFVYATVTILSESTVDASKNCGFVRTLRIRRDAGSATIDDNTLVSSWDTDTFTAPTVALVSDGVNNTRLTVSATGQAGYETTWLARIEALVCRR